MIARDELVVTVGAPAHGGLTVARVDGQVVFVSGALPGETVRVRVTEVKSSFARAAVTDVETASAHRIPQACAAAAAGAGCCDLTYTEPAYARALKAEVLCDVLSRIGRFAQPPGAWDGTVSEVTPGLVAGWRSRTRMALTADGRAGWHAARSDAVVPTVDCRQLPAELTAGLSDLLLTRRPPGGPNAEVIVALDDAGTRHAVRGSATRRGGWTADLLLDGSGIARQRVGTRSFAVPVTAFWQAHRDAVSRYTDLVARWVPDDAQTAWDLYGGVGVFASVLADRGMVVDVVETSADAVRAGRRAFERDPVTFHRRPVDGTLAGLERPDAVVLDPPRAGAGVAVIRKAAAAGPGTVVHIGCDPASFARDLGLWRDAGYVVRDLVAFDAFPGTHHLECLARLTPASAS